MIKIRYSDLPGGLHLSADVRGRHTVLFLLPGLTAAQRKAAIRRARSAARVGHGPVLPALGLARAVAADRIVTTVRNGFAAMRMHPAIFIPPMIMVLLVAIAYVLLVSGSFRFIPPQATGQGPVIGSGAVRSSGSADPGSRPASGAAPGSPGSRSPAPSLHRGPGSPLPGSSASPSPAPSLPRRPASPSPSDPAPSPSPSPSPSPFPSPSPSPTPGSGSGSGGGVCVKVGLLGVCVAV